MLKKCSFELTGIHCVDVLVTEKGLFTWKEGSRTMTLEETGPGVTIEEIRATTDANFEISPTLHEYNITI